MQDKKLSDLRTDSSFLKDAVTFLKSNRLEYTDEDLQDMSASDITDKVLEHMRYQSVNERTMYKDYYYLADETTPTQASTYSSTYSMYSVPSFFTAGRNQTSESPKLGLKPSESMHFRRCNQ